MNPEDFESKYFIDENRYNCPFCKTGSQGYVVQDSVMVSWSSEAKAYVYFVKCRGCGHISYHISDFNFNFSSQSPLLCFAHAPQEQKYSPGTGVYFVSYGPDGKVIESEDFGKFPLDDYFFYHHPSSPFSIDPNVPKKIRALVEEAEGCKNQNFMVGASGALRKAIYEFLIEQKIKKVNAEGEPLNYEERIKLLKEKHPKARDEVFDALAGVQDVTSVDLHEDELGNWEPWKAKEFNYVLEVVKAAMHEVYTAPKKSQDLLTRINEMKDKFKPAKPA